jgi:adenylate cyclase
VLAGNIGTESRKQHSLTGSTVTIASRIVQLNTVHESELLVSGAVLDQLEPGRCAAHDLGEVQLRGIERPTRLYRIA